MSPAPSHADIRHDTIELVVPLQARYNAAVRVVTATAAAELGFTVDDIDDLRLGVEEAVSLFDADDDAAGDDAGARLRVEFHLGAETLSVVVSAQRDGDCVPPAAADPLGRRVLAAVVDSCAIHADRVELVKRRPAG